MDDEQRFKEFCATYGLEETDERKFYFFGGIHSTRKQQPVCWGAFSQVDGSLLGLFDAIPPSMRPKPVPLYAAPVGTSRIPDLTPEAMRAVWKYYEQDGDLIGFALWIQKYSKGDVG